MSFPARFTSVFVCIYIYTHNIHIFIIHLFTYLFLCVFHGVPSHIELLEAISIPPHIPMNFPWIHHCIHSQSSHIPSRRDQPLQGAYPDKPGEVSRRQWNGEKAVPIGCCRALCTSQQQALESIWCPVSWSHLTSSHCSWKLPIPSHCHRSLCPPISSQLISCLLSFRHLISSYPVLCLLSLSQLFSADHNCSHLLSRLLSFPHLFSSQLSFSQVFTFWALPSSCQLTLCLLISSLLTSSKRFSHLLTWSQLLLARLTSS